MQDGELRLRAWRNDLADLSALERLMCDPVTMEHTGGALTKDEARQMLERYAALTPGSDEDILVVFAVERGGEVIGSVDVLRFAGDPRALEIGYALERGSWGRGLGRRAAQLILRVARSMARPGQRIVALADQGHDATIRVLERIGMEPAGLHHDPDDDVDVLLYVDPG